ncbi:hypothetical protein EG68_03738 [Paragonimus skrjabini miyazakii]|uniref:non-specific serine/threonine protein kinase n=1 Tax=Paragonimus skrjabini miyazakii TaxID=59628 RepID=A0A8S9Z084_9TREM|nr:hypothetical protein EG68_03738 [Paragonimus skrjabini miyazakii]
MGNQIAGLTLPPLISVEDCLSDLSGVFRFEEELLGSRLFKVAKAKRVDDGSSQLVVVKVFPCPNGLELMSAYDTLIQAYCRPIASGHNLLSFNVQTSATDRNLLLVRDFIDQSLVDRLCTRPFLCLEEKRWISFQLLHALSQLHRRSKPGLDTRSTDRSTGSEGSAGVLCHGDIKAENVLLTSWGWVLLSDPAPFKPCWLPADNPSEFTHYFDSSRRRVCYLAPERFVELKNVHPTPSSDNLQKEDTSLVMLPSGRAVYLEQDNVKKAKEDVASTSTQSVQSVSVMDDCVEELDLSVSDSNQDVLKPSSSSRFSKSGGGLEPNNEVANQIAYMESDDNSTAMKDVSDISLSARSTSNSAGPEVPLVPSMDLFSAGCVLLEMFTDGTVAFTLADLLAYRGGDCGRLAKLLERIPCEHIKSLITSLLSLDESARGSAESHLAAQKGKAFPAVFYSHLLQYMQTFLESALRNPTVRITYIQRTLSSLLQEIAECAAENMGICAVLLCNLVTSVLRPSGTKHVTQTPNTAASSSQANPHRDETIPVHEPLKPVRPSSNTQLKDHRLLESGKLSALICYLELSKYLNAHLLFDRIIPYCLDLCSSLHSAEVRCLALEALTQILQYATHASSMLPSSPGSISSANSLEVSFLTEYLFPTLAPLSIDSKDEVRLTYARCLPSLADSALRFLESSYVHARYPTSLVADSDTTPATRDLTQTDKYTKTVQPAALETVLNACDAHLSLLRSHIQDRFSDLDRQVRHALMTTDGLAKLAAFFGRSHTSGTLLSHMITFLNDKDDHGLRTSFYRRIVPLITLIGAQSVSVVRPLLEQGLVDPNETVVEVCLRAITQLLNRYLLSAPVAVAFLTRCLSLTAHPTRRLRQGAVAYIAAFARQASEHAPKSLPTGQKWNTSSAHLWSGLCTPASVYARLANAETAKTFFRRPIRECFTSDAVLLTALRPPIGRSILDALVSALTGASATQGARNLQHTKLLLDEFFQLLREREMSRAISRSNENPCYTASNDETVALILAKLRSLGLTELMEAQLIHLFQLVQNICLSTIDHVPQPARGTLTHTKILLASRSRIIDVQHTGGIAQMQSNEKCPIFPEDRFHPSGLSLYVQKLTVALQPAIQRYERLLRRDYFSGRLPLNLSRPANGQKLHLFGRGLIWCPTLHVVSSHLEAVNYTENNAVRSAGTITWVQTELNHSTSVPSSLDRRPATPTWQSDNSLWPSGHPQGTLVAHLHEHRAGLLSLAVHSSGRLMASCSSGDGTVKLWNCGLWPVDSDGYLNQTAIASQRIGGESGTKPASAKPAGLAQIHALPTRSWWTYHTTPADEPPKPCRGLIWIANGNSLVTVSQNRWLHRIDVATGRRCGLEQVSVPDCDRTVCLVASALSQFPDHLNLTRSRLVGGGDAHVVTYATTSNHIVGRDLRIPFKSPPTWCLKQDRGSGLIRSLSMHSCHTWLVTGTSRGQLTIWDLRYERPVACVQHQSQTQAAILGMQVVDVPIKAADASRSRLGRGFHDDENTRSQTLVVAVTDQDNGVTVWDVEACASASSAANTGRNFVVSPNITPVTNGGLVATAWTKSGYSPVRSILCCPVSPSPVTMQSHFLPSVIAGGQDGRLRYWNFIKASDSKILANAAADVRDPNVIYIERFVNGVRTIYEAPNQNAEGGPEKSQNKPSGLLSIQRASSPSTVSFGSAVVNAQSVRRREPEPSKSSAFPVEGGLDLCEPAVGHKNVISDISLLRTSQYLLVSASMDGVIKIWR